MSGYVPFHALPKRCHHILHVIKKTKQLLFVLFFFCELGWGLQQKQVKLVMLCFKTDLVYTPWLLTLLWAQHFVVKVPLFPDWIQIQNTTLLIPLLAFYMNIQNSNIIVKISWLPVTSVIARKFFKFTVTMFDKYKNILLWRIELIKTYFNILLSVISCLVFIPLLPKLLCIL